MTVGAWHTYIPMSSPFPRDIFFLFRWSPSPFDLHIFLRQQYPNQSTDGPLHLQRLGIGTSINDDADAPLTPRLAQPSGDRRRRYGVQRVFAFVGIWFGGTCGQQPHNAIIIGGGWAVPPDQLSNLSMALLDNLSTHIFPGEFIINYNTFSKGGKQNRHFVCKGVMILLDHRSSWDCVSTHVSDGHIRGCTRSTHNNQ